MRRSVILTLLLIGCASAAPDSKKAPLTEPEIRISQLSNVSEAARNITGSIAVEYRVDIANRAPEVITIKRIDAISLGEGAYTLRPTSVPVSARLNSGEVTALQFWGSAFIVSPTILGANGPVTLRVTIYYETPTRSSQSIVVQQVHAGFAD